MRAREFSSTDYYVNSGYRRTPDGRGEVSLAIFVVLVEPYSTGPLFFMFSLSSTVHPSFSSHSRCRSHLIFSLYRYDSSCCRFYSFYVFLAFFVVGIICVTYVLLSYLVFFGVSVIVISDSILVTVKRY